jgi:hypothetical protein
MLLLIPGLGLLAEAARSPNLRYPRVSSARLRRVGEITFGGLAGVLLPVALLAAPAGAADALGRGRARGPLGHLLVTDLSAAEVVLGAFAARLLPVLALLLAAAPVAMFQAAWFETDPAAVLTLAAVSAGIAVLGVALATALSLWTRRPYEALLAVYALGVAWLLSKSLWSEFFRTPPPSWLVRIAHPFALAWPLATPIPIWMALNVQPYHPGSLPSPADGAVFLGGTSLLAALLLALTALGLRAAATRERQQPNERRPGLFARLRDSRRRLADRLRLPGPTLDGNPILWREWRHARRSRWGSAFRALYTVVMAAMTVLCAAEFWHGQTNRPDLVAVAGYATGLGLLAVAVRSASAWSEERAAGPGGLDVLLATPLSGSEMVRGQWWACYRGVLGVAVIPAVAAVILAAGAPTWPYVPKWFSPVAPLAPLRPVDRLAVAAVVIGQVLLYGAAVVSLGLWLATRLKRTTRAVVAAVVAYGLVTLVWPTLVEVFLMRVDRTLYGGLGAASPLGGPIITLSSMFTPFGGTPRTLVPYAVLWLPLAALAAAGLRWWTGRSFDHWMGRMSAAAGGPGAGPLPGEPPAGSRGGRSAGSFGEQTAGFVRGAGARAGDDSRT